MNTTVALPLMRREGQLSPASFRSEDNAVDVIWTTGATVRRARFTWDEGTQEFDEELIVSGNAVRLDRLNGGAPLLDSHNQFELGAVIGAVVPGSARIVKGQGLARVQLSRAEQDAATVSKIADGIIRNISVGYRIHRVEKTERDGQIPLVRVTDWEPMELSAVPIGADPGAAIRAQTEQERYPCIVEGGQAERGRVSSLQHAATRMRMIQRQHFRPLFS